MMEVQTELHLIALLLMLADKDMHYDRAIADAKVLMEYQEI